MCRDKYCDVNSTTMFERDGDDIATDYRLLQWFCSAVLQVSNLSL